MNTACPSYLRQALTIIAHDTLNALPGDHDWQANNDGFLDVKEMPKIRNGPSLRAHTNVTYHSMQSKQSCKTERTPCSTIITFILPNRSDLVAVARIFDERGTDVSDKVTTVYMRSNACTIVFNSLHAAQRFLVPLLARMPSPLVYVKVTLSTVSQSSLFTLDVHEYFVKNEIRLRVFNDWQRQRFRVWPVGDGRSLVTMGDQWRVTPQYH